MQADVKPSNPEATPTRQSSHLHPHRAIREPKGYEAVAELVHKHAGWHKEQDQ
jgi:hypothetical protein